MLPPVATPAQAGEGASAGFTAADAPHSASGEPQDAFSNVSGTSDHIVVVNATGTDKTFTLEVYTPAAGGDPEVVCDAIAYDENNTPPVAVGPGKRARVKDNPDTDNRPVRGDVTIDPSGD